MCSLIDSAYHGSVFSRIRLEFKDGRIVKASSQVNDELFQVTGYG